jgi:hypothetical protein
MNSPTDQTRVTVGYVTGNKITPLPESALTGGALGGVLEFRSKSLDLAQNSLGRIALGLAQTFNDQHHLGLDGNGNPGGDFFTVAPAEVGKNINNNQTSTTDLGHRQRRDPAHHQRLQGRLRRHQLQRDAPVGQQEDRDLAVPADRAADHRRPGLRGQRRGRHRRQLPGAPDHQRRRRPEAGADRRLADRGRRADRHQRPADQQGHRQDQRRQVDKNYLAAADRAGEPDLRQGQRQPDRLPGGPGGDDDGGRRDHHHTPAGGNVPFKDGASYTVAA